MAPLAFRPWPRDSGPPEPLKEVLGRIALERGHFRDITEASLREEIAADGALEPSDDSDGDEIAEEDEENDASRSDKATSREELWRAKMDMQTLADNARNEVMFALDYVSLLLSESAPKLGEQTMSPMLKQNVPSGTLGVDIWQHMPDDAAQRAQDQLLATNVKIESLQESADSLLAAAGRLEDNVRKETQYWDQILSITERGWNVCKLPGQQHRLGVTFGFSESAPQFERQGVAALNAGADGGVALERGIGRKPKALRVEVRRAGSAVGRSKVPVVLDGEETTLEARIRRARDSLFDEELYYEMVRESRSVTSLGVGTRGQALWFSPEGVEDGREAPEVVFELVSLEEVGKENEGSGQEDGFAQAIVLAARLLLSQAHRERLKKRSNIPPPRSERQEETPLLPILRPIMSYMLHQAALDQVNALVNRLAALLDAAQVHHSGQQAELALPVADIANAEALVELLKQTWTSEASLAIGESVLRLQLETTLARAFGPVFVLTAPTGKAARFTTADEARAAADELVASQLAQGLATKAGDQWRCTAREALLSKVNDDDPEAADVNAWITVNSEGGAMSLNTMTKETVWRMGRESARESLHEAFAAMSS